MRKNYQTIDAAVEAMAMPEHVSVAMSEIAADVSEGLLALAVGCRPRRRGGRGGGAAAGPRPGRGCRRRHHGSCGLRPRTPHAQVGAVSPDVVAVETRRSAQQQTNAAHAAPVVVSLEARRLAELTNQLPLGLRPPPSVVAYDSLLTRTRDA